MSIDAVDNVVSPELKSLQDELSAAQRERSTASAAASAMPPGAAEPVKESQEDHKLQDQLRELADKISHFFAEAENLISAHPAQSVVSALSVGVLIGLLLGRRQGATP